MDSMPEKIDSKFRYVLVTAARAENLMHGARPKLATDNPKLTSVAMKEVDQDLVDWDFGPPGQGEEVEDGGEGDLVLEDEVQ